MVSEEPAGVESEPSSADSKSAANGVQNPTLEELRIAPDCLANMALPK
jgi:hypothetical protein